MRWKTEENSGLGGALRDVNQGGLGRMGKQQEMDKCSQHTATRKVAWTSSGDF